MHAICSITGTPFTISEHEQEYCNTRGIPLPKFHPHERLKRILSFRNRTFLYNDVCAFSHKPILSCIPPDRGYTVYDGDVWNSDQWDTLASGLDYDPNRPFFEQLGELLKKAPLPNLTVVKSSLENSDYVNGAVNLKNCYLCFASVNDVDCFFLWNAYDNKNTVECISTFNSELCYRCSDVNNCYRVSYAESCNNCSESYFLESCQSCKNCFGCINLRLKEYCWYNAQLTKEAFDKRLAEMKKKLGSYLGVHEEMEKFTAFKKGFPRKYMQGTNNENCTGNYIHNGKDCHSSFHGTGSMDLEHCVGANLSKDTFCTAFCKDAELVYNTQAGTGNYNIQYCAECIQCRDLMFCLYCMQGTSDCFGCVGLKKKSHCILNKQYTKEEYEQLVILIKKQMIEHNEWQDYLPPNISPMYYNQSDAAIMVPLTEDEALAQGFSWFDERQESSSTAYTIPDAIGEVSDAILETTLQCELTGKKFRIVKPELAFYRNMNIPIPHTSPLQRIHTMGAIFRIHTIHKISCSNCKKEIDSVYDPTKRPVLCEACYVEAKY